MLSVGGVTVEVWKDIEGYEGHYQVSNMGRVKSLSRLDVVGRNRVKERVLKLVNDAYGYHMIGLYKDGARSSKKVHRLVANAFIYNEHNKPEVNHKDEDKKNNRADNLEWATRLENEHHGTKQLRKVKNTDYKAVAAKNSKIVLQYDLNGDFVKEWSSIAEVRNTLGYCSGNISSCCNGRIKRVYNSIWKFKAAV